MGENSKIGWTDHTFNPWVGCTKVSTGCTNCYAEALMDLQYGKVQWGPNGTRVRTTPANWRKPHKWNREAEKAGVRRRVFCASLADVFEERPELDEWRDDLFAVIEETPHLDWLLLTKRPAYANEWLDRYYETLSHDSIGGEVYGLRDPLPNVWLGTSVEDQYAADMRISRLLKTRAAMHFLSCEPLLGAIDLERWLAEPECTCYEIIGGHQMGCPFYGTPLGATRAKPVDWVIIGGESGRNSRACQVAWIVDLVNQCHVVGCPVFVKQDSGPKPGKQGRIPDELWIQEFPESRA